VGAHHGGDGSTTDLTFGELRERSRFAVPAELVDDGRVESTRPDVEPAGGARDVARAR
jgi:hypothetical protein